MKKTVLYLIFLALSTGFRAQISYDNTYSYTGYNLATNKFHTVGYKYVKTDIANMKIEIYNVNHSIFKTINIPPQTLPNINVLYVSDNLFDTDNMVEYAVTTYSSASMPPFFVRYKFVIYKENGTQIFTRDSARIIASSYNDVFNNIDGVFFDGVKTKMRLQIYATTSPNKTEIYTLPGSIPCAQCIESATTTGISTNGSPGTNPPVFFPNPVIDQLKLKYELPKDYKNADIKVYDLQGKLIETFKVTDTFDFIYLPSDYNNGLYLYAFDVDGKTIKTEKIILNK